MVGQEKDKKSEDQCALCNATANSRCGGCSKVSYCTKEHQKKHWKIHKGECCAWKVCESTSLGRYLTAVRDIKAGEVILRERPILLTPPKVTPAICLGCYREFNTDPEEQVQREYVEPRPCPKCGWPMCQNDECINSPEHAAECAIAEARGGAVIRDFNVDHPVYRSIGILRVLGLKDRHPDKYQKLLNLQSHSEKQRLEDAKAADSSSLHSNAAALGRFGGEYPEQRSEIERDKVVTVKVVRGFFQRKDVDEDTILNLISIIETNGHEIPIPNARGHINRRLIGVYNNTSFLEHNCKPNCVKTFDMADKAIVIRSAVPIKKGTNLSISYVDPLWGTNDRCNFLQMTKYFTCKCTRCRDPTELGAHVSSLRCQSLKCCEKTGLESLVIPEDPFAPEKDWVCIACKETYPVGYVSSIVNKIGKDMDELHEKFGDIPAIEEFVKKSSKFLSPFHFYLLEMKVELAQLYGRTPDEPILALAPRKLLRKIQLCEELLIVLNKIYPGYNRLRGIITYELQAAVCTLSKMKFAAGEIPLDKHLDELMQCGKWMTEVIKVLGWEPENSIEKQRADGAAQDLQLLKSMVLSIQGDQNEGAQPSTSMDDMDNSPDRESFIEEVF
ncbi:Protein msta, isoform A [Orchesella cincta]|uniref:Protein msta, isoform A n=1 Tax=Orchesella cincta TaxID=48709 RepID=A0A1D2MXT4_ORCCI|nr:Protein msta, isoform A [Orchesella cincta]